MKKHVLIMTLSILLLLAINSEVTAKDNQTDTDVGGIISTDTTWTVANSPYNLISDVQIDTPATLTIEPDVVVYGTGLAIET